MTILGRFTNVGLEKCRAAQLNLGWKIVPNGFGVSDEKSPGATIDDLKTLTAANASQWYSGLISSRVIVSTDTITFYCVIPSLQAPDFKHIREIYLYAKDVDNNNFLLAVGWTGSDSVIYDPSGTTTLRLSVKLTNSDLTGMLNFLYTQATEISQHNADPNAHPSFRDDLEKAGIFDQPSQHSFIGQHWDEFATFSGVSNGDLVYKDTDGVYKRAIADGTIKQNVAGIASVTNGAVYAANFVTKATGYAPNTKLFLSAIAPGQFSDTPSAIPVGHVLTSQVVMLRVDHLNYVNEWVDTVCSDEVGYKNYVNLQDAINACPNHGWVLVRKLYEVRGASPLNTNGKTINFLFTGTGSGIKQFLGRNAIQRVDLATPVSGEYVLVHSGNKTGRLAYNADATAVQSALEALTSITSVTVAGTYSTGFTIEFVGGDGLQPQSQIDIGPSPGIDEVQTVSFDTIPDEGTFRLSLDGSPTGPVAYNEGAAELQTALNALGALSAVFVTGSFATGFIVTFTGADGHKPQSQLVVHPGSNSLKTIGTTVVVTPGTTTEGELPDNTTGVVIAGTQTQLGEVPGAMTGLVLDQPGCQLIGLGLVQGFMLGVDLNEKPQTRIEMVFDGCVNPIDYSNLGLTQFSVHGSIGIDLTSEFIDETGFGDLAEVRPTVPASKILEITSAERLLSDGSKYGMVVGQSVSSYSGGTANYEDGTVTGGGANFVPFTPTAPGRYYKYAVVLQVNNTIKVVVPTGDSANAISAPIPSITGGRLRAIVTCHDAGMGAAGDIDLLTAASIKKFTDPGAFSENRMVVSITAPAGASDFDTSSQFIFDPSNVVRDLKVQIDGVEQVHGTDWTKLDDHTIQFIDGASPFSIPSGLIEIEYVGSQINSIIQNAIMTRWRTYRYEVVNPLGESEVEIPVGEGWSFDPSNTVYDVEVLENKSESFQDPTGAGDADFLKLSGTRVKFTSAGGAARLLQQGTVVTFKSREYSLGGSDAIGLRLKVTDEGSLVDANVTELDVVGDHIQAAQVSPGKVRVTCLAEINTIQTVGVGQDLFVGKVGENLQLRSVRAASGIAVTIDGNELVIGLAPSTEFRRYVSDCAGPSVPVGSIYDPASRKLAVYKNGLRMLLSANVGPIAARYTEAGVNYVSLFYDAQVTDSFAFLNRLVTPSYLVSITGFAATVLNVPTYVVGSKRLRVWRNGALMNTSGHGDAAFRYVETGVNTITLDQAPTINEVFVVEYAPAALGRDDIASVVGSSLTLATSMVPGQFEKLELYRNGVLMFDTVDPAIGTASQRYQVVDATHVTLELGANLTDFFTATIRP